MSGFLLNNNKIVASWPSPGGACPPGSWLVVPLVKGKDGYDSFHIVRRVDVGGKSRFINLLGPDAIGSDDRFSIPAWIKRGDEFATLDDLLDYFSSDRTPWRNCNPMCVGPAGQALPHSPDEDQRSGVAIDLSRLAGTWRAAEQLLRPANDPDFGRWIGYRAPRCDTDTWLLDVKLHVGQQALNFLGRMAPRDMASSTGAALSVASNIMDPEATKHAGVNVTFAGRVDVRSGRLEFNEVVYDTRGPDAASRRGEVIRQQFRPWVVQASPGIRMRVTSIGANHFRALVDWESPCQRELLFVRPDVPLSGAALR